MKKLLLLLSFLFISFRVLPQDDNTKLKDFISEGIKLHDLKKYDQAIASYKEALKIEPTNPSANYEIAFSLMSKGETKNAIPYLEKVTKTKNNVSVSAFDMLGSIYDDMGKKDKAIEYFNKGIEADPTYQRIYFNAAVTSVRMGKDKEALAYLLTALKLDPNHASSHNLYAELMMKSSTTKIDAILAYCNFLILEPTSERSVSAYKNLKALMGSGVSDSPKGNTISIGSGGDTEQNAANLSVSISGLSAMIPGLSENGKLEQQLKSIFSTVGEISSRKADKGFFWTFYADYFGKIGKSEYMPLVAHIIGFTGNEKENEKWIKDNEVQFIKFGKWEEENARK